MVNAIQLLKDDDTDEHISNDDSSEQIMKFLELMKFPIEEHTAIINKQSEVYKKVSACRKMSKVLRTGNTRNGFGYFLCK